MLLDSRIVMTCLVALGLSAGSFAQDDAKLRPAAKPPARRGYYRLQGMKKYTAKSIT